MFVAFIGCVGRTHTKGVKVENADGKMIKP
jgi:hypothetical protein